MGRILGIRGMHGMRKLGGRDAGANARVLRALPGRGIRFVLTLILALSGVAFAGFAAFGAFAPSSAYAIDADSNLVDPTQRADNSFIYDTTVASLINQASLYEDRTVQVVGEVIGDKIRADEPDRTWITLTETDAGDQSSISVLLSSEQAKQIDRFGRYGVIGTTLQVRGTYHQACDEHDGLPDIHATTSSVLSRGQDVPDTFDVNDFVPGIITVIIGFGLLAAFHFARERTR